MVYTAPFIGLVSLALGLGHVTAAPAAAKGNLTCTPKIRGVFKAVEDGGGGFPGLFYPLSVNPLRHVIDSSGAKASYLLSDNSGFQIWDFEQCDSEYMGLESTSDKFFGQLRKAKRTLQGGVQDPSKIPTHCLATVATDLAIDPQNFNNPVVTNVTNSLNCDSDDVSQVQRFFSASYDESLGSYNIQFVGATKPTKDKYGQTADPLVGYKRDFEGGPLYFTISSGEDSDRKASPPTRRDAGSGGFYADSLALPGRIIGSS